MKQKDRELLLKDLCARLPYNVVIRCVDSDTNYKCFLTTDILVELLNDTAYYDYKPYLRPMSSMTEEEEIEYHGLCYPEWNNGGLDGGNWHYHNTISSIDWLNAHHIDYRNLIEEGLAIEAPKNMYEEE